MLETNVAGLEIHVAELQRQLNNVMEIMARHDMQVLPSDAASSVMLLSEAASSEFEVLSSDPDQREVLQGSEDPRRGRAALLPARR